jgi:3,4-dihydroxy 2-butanone 4-phosphate synthase/GTP cyclohydrolase II
MSLTTIPVALDALRAGRPVIVVDDEGRENEGDVVLSAQLATQETIAWTVRNSSGFLCAPMTNEIADRMELPLMVVSNEDVRGTAYTVTVDSARGVTTGISAADRAHTLRVLADPASQATDVRRPGHILPLRALDGGVRQRPGHTEASVDLMRLAGLVPVAAISEIVAEDGEMMRLPGLLAFGEREGVPVITIAALIEWLEREAPADPDAAPALTESSQVIFEVETTVPTSRSSPAPRAPRARSCACTRSASPVRRSARSSASAGRSSTPRSTPSSVRAASSCTCAARRAAGSA